MRFKFVFILSFIVFTYANGNSFGIMTGNIGNVYYGGIVAGETQYQNQAIAFLCNEYIKNYHSTYTGEVFLELGFGKISNYKLSYDLFEGDMWQFAEKNRPAKGRGIRIILSQKDHRAESVLKLLEYGINNLSDLKKANKEYYNLDYYDRSDDLTVDSAILKQVIEAPINESIKSILSIKVYRNLRNSGPGLYTEYYFQNDKFYFIDFMHNDSMYLQLNQVYQLINDYYLGTIIFETDSTGYFYSRETKHLSPKFKIEDKKESFYYDHTSSDQDKKRIYFEYEAYKGKKKFIYLTDKFILIQKVEEFEDEMIKREIEKCTKG